MFKKCQALKEVATSLSLTINSCPAGDDYTRIECIFLVHFYFASFFNPAIMRICDTLVSYSAQDV